MRDIEARKKKTQTLLSKPRPTRGILDGFRVGGDAEFEKAEKENSLDWLGRYGFRKLKELKKRRTSRDGKAYFAISTGEKECDVTQVRPDALQTDNHVCVDGRSPLDAHVAIMVDTVIEESDPECVDVTKSFKNKRSSEKQKWKGPDHINLNAMQKRLWPGSANEDMRNGSVSDTDTTVEAIHLVTPERSILQRVLAMARKAKSEANLSEMQEQVRINVSDTSETVLSGNDDEEGEETSSVSDSERDVNCPRNGGMDSLSMDTTLRRAVSDVALTDSPLMSQERLTTAYSHGDISQPFSR